MTDGGICLKTRLSYYQMMRSISITYEECVRLFKQIPTVVSYCWGKIILLDIQQLADIAAGQIP